MAALSGNRVAWTYTDDNGVPWRVAAQLAIVTQGKSGGALAADSLAARPNWGKMRRVTVSGTGGKSRTVVCYEKDAPIGIGGATINVNVDGDVATLKSHGGILSETRQGGRTTYDQT